MEFGNQPIHALMLESDTPSFTRVVHVPTLTQWEVNGVSQSGNKTGNNYEQINYKAAGRPLSRPTDYIK